MMLHENRARAYCAAIARHGRPYREAKGRQTGTNCQRVEKKSKLKETSARYMCVGIWIFTVRMEMRRVPTGMSCSCMRNRNGIG